MKSCILFRVMSQVNSSMVALLALLCRDATLMIPINNPNDLRTLPKYAKNFPHLQAVLLFKDMRICVFKE